MSPLRRASLFALLLMLGGCRWVAGYDPAADVGAVADGGGADASGDLRSDTGTDLSRGDGTLDVARDQGVALDGARPDVGCRWKQLAAVWNPGKRHWPKLTFWALTNKLYLYGGLDKNGSATADLWSYDSANGWLQVDANSAPGPRVGHAFVAAGSQLLLYGGADGEWSEPQGDLWRYNGASWSKISFGGVDPGPRFRTLSAYDAKRDQLVVFGGMTSQAATPDAQTLRYGVATNKWLSGATASPPARQDWGSAMTYVGDKAKHVALRERVVLYGGGATSSSLSDGRDDLWVFDGASWIKICDACTGTKRQGAALAYHAATARLVIYGGFGNGTELEGTFELGAGALLTLTCTSLPSARDGMGIAAFTGVGDLLLYGGNGNGCVGGGTGAYRENCAETWLYE